jgi:hypothetical protein
MDFTPCFRTADLNSRADGDHCSQNAKSKEYEIFRAPKARARFHDFPTAADHCKTVGIEKAVSREWFPISQILIAFFSQRLPSSRPAIAIAPKLCKRGQFRILLSPIPPIR